MSCLRRKQKSTYAVNNEDSLPAINVDSNERKKSSGSCISYRYYIAALVFISNCMLNAQRLGVAIAVVNMTNYTSAAQQNRSFASCPATEDAKLGSSKTKMGGEFDWNPKLQGFILGAGFLGNAFTPMVSGPLADAIGAKKILLWGNIVGAAGMLISPLASWWHVYSLIAVQFIRGIAEGFIMPSNFLVMANWTPRGERGFISSFMLTGYHTGSLLGGMISGYLCESAWLGWQAVFYFFGGAGVIFCILFALTFYETPKDHPKISAAELRYITEDQVTNKNQKKPPTPWLKIFTSIPTYALMYGLFGRYWSIFYFLSVHPVYLSTILHYPITQNGLISSLPFILKIMAALLASSFSDWLYRKRYVGVDRLRKGCTFIGCLAFSLSMLGIYVARCNGLVNILLLCVTLFSVGIGTPGSMIAVVDMTPNFSATLMGVLATVFNLSGFIIPVMVGYMTKYQTLEEWQNVFFINIALVMSSGLVFVLFGSAEVQPWNFTKDENVSVMKDAKEPTVVGNALKTDINTTEIAMDKLDSK